MTEHRSPASALAALADRAWDETLVRNPVAATAYGDRRFDDRLPANGPGAAEAAVAELRALRADVLRVDPDALDEDDRVTHAALLDFVDHELGLAESGIDVWAVDPLDGPQVAFLNIPSFQSVRSTADGEALVARWRAMGPWLDEHVARGREAAANGIVPAGALVRSVTAELDDLLGRPVDEWPLMEPAVDPPAEWPPADRARFAADVRAAVERAIRPAFARYRAFLADELGPIARPDDRAGLSHVPGGGDAFARVVGAHTTLALRPDEIHRIGEDETERIDAEFRRLGERLLGTHDQAEILRRLRSDPALHFGTPEEVFAVAEDSLARANGAIPDWFGRLPKTPCVVLEMQAHEADHSTIAYYRQPAADGSRPGAYYINTTKPETRPRYEAETLAFHEAVPGHHLQIALAQELDGLPAFRRLAGPTAFVEGWGLYSERLSAEMGLLSSELAELGVASYDAWRASRLVVDTGLHALGWTRDQAIDFMLEHTALAENNIVNEVDRYLAIPGQALAYKLGQLELLRLRRRASETLGARFDIRAFHDAVLGQGAVGLPTLGGIVDRWIATRPG
jgi:uncharacterized protein (DUF885 family)